MPFKMNRRINQTIPGQWGFHVWFLACFFFVFVPMNRGWFIPSLRVLTTSTGWWLTYPSEKYEFVSWDDDISNIWKVIQNSMVPVTTNQWLFTSYWDDPPTEASTGTTGATTVSVSSRLELVAGLSKLLLNRLGTPLVGEREPLPNKKVAEFYGLW